MSRDGGPVQADLRLVLARLRHTSGTRYEIRRPRPNKERRQLEVIASIFVSAGVGTLIVYLLIQSERKFEALRRRYTRRPTIDEVRIAVRYLGVEITDTDERFARAKAARVIFRWLRTESKFRADKDVQIIAAGIYAKALVDLICVKDDGIVDELIKESIRQCKKPSRSSNIYYRYTEGLNDVIRQDKNIAAAASIKVGQFIQLPTEETRRMMLSFYRVLRWKVTNWLYPID